ncbi:phasin family protein [Pseudomonas sp. B392_1p]|jgi:poly(hydroxyalkanoate) granule-associated protein|uniref:phasin family protein n=1 Tax=Pseudomonas sp. B392_1p TaxID=3457507 RepID=UPI003FD2E2FC
MDKAALKKTDTSPSPVATVVKRSARQLWLAYLGAYARLGRSGLAYFKDLVEHGEEAENKGKRLLDEQLDAASGQLKTVKNKVGARLEKVEQRVGTRVGRVLKRAGVPTRGEVEDLSSKLDGLSELLIRTAKP